MKTIERIAVGLVAASVVIGASSLLFPSASQAGLSRPPASYVVPTDDGRHLFVMISPTLAIDDRGRHAVLPDGHRVDLRATFPSSGLYKLGTTVPVWKVEWYENDRLIHLSYDGRYAVRINRNAGGGYREEFPPRWGIVFYDEGTEINRYDVQDLVDYPSLIGYSTEDYRYQWFDDSAYYSGLIGTCYTLRTSTHERYRFDVTTGDVLEEHRLWRPLARGGIVGLAVVVMAAACFILRRRKTRRDQPVELPVDPVNVGTPERRRSRFSYGLKVLFLLQAMVALYFWSWEAAVFAACLAVAIAVTRWPHRRAAAREMSPKRSRLRRAARWGGIAIAWILSYFVSLFPAGRLLQHFDAPYDVRMVVLRVAYAPLFWALLEFPALQWPLVLLEW